MIALKALGRSMRLHLSSTHLRCAAQHNRELTELRAAPWAAVSICTGFVFKNYALLARMSYRGQTISENNGP